MLVLYHLNRCYATRTQLLIGQLREKDVRMCFSSQLWPQKSSCEPVLGWFASWTDLDPAPASTLAPGSGWWGRGICVSPPRCSRIGWWNDRWPHRTSGPSTDNTAFTFFSCFLTNQHFVENILRHLGIKSISHGLFWCWNLNPMYTFDSQGFSFIFLNWQVTFSLVCLVVFCVCFFKHS